MKFRNQIGSDTDFGVIPDNTIQAEMSRYGTGKCGEVAPYMQCKCDEDGDGNNDYAIPLMETANTGAWVPYYTAPLTPFQEAVINQICCANVCDSDDVIMDGDGFNPPDDDDTDLGLDFGPSIMPTGSDGFTPLGGFGGTTPRPRPRPRPRPTGFSSFPRPVRPSRPRRPMMAKPMRPIRPTRPSRPTPRPTRPVRRRGGRAVSRPNFFQRLIQNFRGR